MPFVPCLEEFRQQEEEIILRRLHVYRNKGLEFTLRLFGRWWGFAFSTASLYGNGRRWWVSSVRCLCQWYGSDLYDGCSECERGTPVSEEERA